MTCRAADLRLEVRPHGGAMGRVYGAVQLVNDAAPPCLVRGTFTLEFLDAPGVVALRAEPPALAREQMSHDAPGWAVAGRAHIVWNGYWCERDRPLVEARVRYDGVTFTTPHEPWAGGGACGQATARGHLSVWPFGAVPVAHRTPPPAVLRAGIAAPSHAVAGETLVYHVTLSNVSARTVQLDPCPYYVEWLGGRPVASSSPPPGQPPGKPWSGDVTYAGVAKESYSLHCAPVGAIPVGGSVTFEMRLHVPADALGPDTLRWSLGGPNSTVASSQLVIERR